jgi:hypothetical protein
LLVASGVVQRPGGLELTALDALAVGARPARVEHVRHALTADHNRPGSARASAASLRLSPCPHRTVRAGIDLRLAQSPATKKSQVPSSRIPTR